MAHYIDKDVIVEEIEKRLDELWDLLPNASDVIKDNYTKEEANITGKYTALDSIENFINTIEVKEVDLEKEINKIDDVIPGKREDIEYIAKHFFELGIKAQKGE